MIGEYDGESVLPWQTWLCIPVVCILLMLIALQQFCYKPAAKAYSNYRLVLELKAKLNRPNQIDQVEGQKSLEEELEHLEKLTAKEKTKLGNNI